MSSLVSRVCVVGAGPAGLAAAIALRQTGCEVMVVDCAVPPVDKACGEGLMPDCVAALGELGIEIPLAVGFPFHGIRFSNRLSSVQADFPNGLARGVRRTVLHNLLIQHAANLGVPIRWNAKHVQLTGYGVSLSDCAVKADFVIGADGQNSSVRRQANLDKTRRQSRRYGFRRHFKIAPWSPYMELHWGSRSQIYVTPVAGDEVCVAVLSRDSQLRLQEALSDFPDLYYRLENTEPVSAEMGAISASRALVSVYRGNIALVGDASGSVDAITGEGICVSIKQARALAMAIKSGSLAEYQREHRKLMSRPQTMASLMLMLEPNAGLQRRALAGLAQSPDLFRSLLEIHVGTADFADLCSWNLFNFGRAFLAA
jgi:flavin-dependent dehydrogenase